MTRKEIKKFYLSLIDNPDARWSKTECEILSKDKALSRDNKIDQILK